MNTLVERLVQLSGLSPIFAPRVIRRAIERAGHDPDTLQRTDLDDVLPEIQRVLVVYLGESGARDRAVQIRAAVAG